MVGPCCSRCGAPVAGCWGGVRALRVWRHSKRPSRHRCPVRTRSHCCSPTPGSGASSSTPSSTGESGRLRGGWATLSPSLTSQRRMPCRCALTRRRLCRCASIQSLGHPRRRRIAALAASTRPRRWRALLPGRSGCVLRGCCGGLAQQRNRALDGRRDWLGPALELARARRAGRCCSSTTYSPPGPRCRRRPLRWRVPVLPPSMWQRVHDEVSTAISRVPNMALPSFRAVPTELSTCSES